MFSALLSLSRLPAAHAVEIETDEPKMIYAPVEDPANAGGEMETELPGETAEYDTIAQRIESLTVRERVAQLMIVTAMGMPLPNAADRQLVARYTPGGVIIPPLLRPGNVVEYANSLHNLSPTRAKRIPLFVAADPYALATYGWGPDEYFPPLPSLLAVAAANDPTATQGLASLIGDQLALLGVNMQWGPSLELAPDLPEIPGTIHCLGSSPQFAGDVAAAFVETMITRGILPVPTGFPGGGQNRKGDGPAVLFTPSALLNGEDLLPYRRAVESGAELIHVGATYVPTVDNVNKAACLSPVVMGKLLREDLGFTGVIVAGPPDIQDVTQLLRPDEAVLQMFRAGADMIYWTHTDIRVVKTIEYIVKAIEDGNLDQKVIDSALERVLELKERHKLFERPAGQKRSAEKLERKKQYPEAAYDVERKSITVVVNRNNTLPLAQKSRWPVGITGVVAVEELQEPLGKYIKHVSAQPIKTAEHTGDIQQFEIDRLTRRNNGIKTVVYVTTSKVRMGGQLRLIEELKSSGKRVVVVLMGYPDGLADLAAADAAVLAYCRPDAAEESMRAVADVLYGEAPVGILAASSDPVVTAGVPEQYNALDLIRVPAGRLPVTIGDAFAAGLGLAYDPSLSVKKVEWVFGDGDKDKGLVVTKAFNEPGRYPVTLTVTDTSGAESSRTFHVNSEPLPGE